MTVTTADINKIDEIVAEKTKTITLVSFDGNHIEITYEAVVSRTTTRYQFSTPIVTKVVE